MWYISIFDAKENATQKDIERLREEWLNKGKDQELAKKCHSIERYEVLGKTPLKVFFIIETDNPNVLNILSRYFGDAWNCITYPITKREILEELKEDHTIIGG
ncbi:MAG: hypothetical protein AABY42_03925 [Nitrospirota bacterium]